MQAKQGGILMPVNITPPRILKGNSVNLDIRTRDPAVETIPFVAADSVLITLTDPLGNIRISNQAVSLVSGRIGLYRYVYQTQPDYPSGDWIEYVVVTRDGAINIERAVAFTLHG